MTPTYRRGTPADAPACVDIIVEWAEQSPWLDELDPRSDLIPFWTELFGHELVWIAEINGQIAGFCTRGDDNIGALYVSDNHRSKGLGKHLLDLAKEDRDWITVWAYEANKAARRFYRREGLVEISREMEEHSNLVNVEHQWHRKQA